MNNIVLVVDKPLPNNMIITGKRNDLEGNSAEQTNRLIASLESISTVCCYYGPEDFEKNISKHKKDIVLPMYYGAANPKSKGIVPAICDNNSICYIGGDTYTQVLCNDKSLSKLYAHSFGIESAGGVLIRNNRNADNDLRSLKTLSAPLIVKPNFGGGSTGISDSGIAYTPDDALKTAYGMLDNLHIPILIEEYIPGYEVELIICGNKNGVKICKEVGLKMDQKILFDHQIWGYESKDIDDSKIEFYVSDFITADDMQKLIRLFLSFDKIEIARFDGRIKDGKFYLLELSPDCYLGDDCAVYYAFKQIGFSHAEMFKYLIHNALNQD